LPCRIVRGERVRLVTLAAAQLEGIASPVQAFDHTVAHVLLARALESADAEHGLCARIRQGPHGVELLVVARAAAPFTPAECAWLELMAGQIRAALELGDRLASPVATTASAAQLARLFPMPCMLVDAAGRCVETSQAFAAMRDTFSVWLRTGRVVFADAFVQACWRQALLEAHAAAATRSFSAEAAGGSRWKVHVVPLPLTDSDADGAPGRLLFVLLENTGAAQALAVPSSSLTRAELEVLAGLLHGQSAKAIARTRGASVNTVRSQITAILGKTGHHTQKQLIASFSTGSFDGAVRVNGARGPS
jgi:DNA-binding CsgD family transcriptional regulator